MATRKLKDKKVIVKKPHIPEKGSKTRKKPIYKSFRLHKKIKHTSPPIVSWWVLFKKAMRLMAANKKQIIGLFLLLSILMIVFVRGFQSPLNIDSVSDTFSDILDEDVARFATGFTTFGLIINASAQGASEISQLYQSMLIIISSLAVIWLFRQQQAGSKVTLKMSFYRGMYPLIPFLLVCGVIILQLLPAIIGNYLFSTVVQAGLIIGLGEQIAWVSFLILTVLLSLYMLTSSLMALYIVTLPEMTPMQSLREARELVRYRRFSIMRKVIALLLILLLIAVIFVLPVIFISPTVAEWLFFAMTILAIPLVNGYMFSLYRELL